MKEALTIKETQDGFAGQTGTVWTIDPNCRFTIARQVGPKVGDPYQEGRLTPEQTTQLAGLLAQFRIETLPDSLGKPQPVNAHQITLVYGGKTAVLTLPPGSSEPDGLAGGDPDSKRLLDLANGVKNLIGS